MSTLNSILYVRKSRSVEGHTIEEDLEKQRVNLLSMAEIKGYKVLEIFEEIGSSIDAERKQFNKMIEMIEKGDVHVVIISAIDRIARSLGIFERFLQVCKDNEVLIETPREQIDLSHDGSELLALIQSVLAKSEYGQIKRRLAEGKVDAVAVKGRWIGTGAPFGYIYDKESKTLIPNEETKHIYRKMVELSLEGNSYSQVADKLNELGYKTKTGKFWSAGRVMNILKNRVYLGEAVYNSTTIKRSGHAVDCHEPLITPEEYNAVAKLSEARRNYNERTGWGKTKTLVDNLLYCAKCHRKVSIFLQKTCNTRQRKNPFYTARTCIYVDSMTGIKCDNGGCKVDHIEEYVLSDLEEVKEELHEMLASLHLNNSDTSINIIKDKIKKVASEISKNEEGIKRVTNAYVQQAMDFNEFSNWKKELSNTNDALRVELTKAENQLKSLDIGLISEKLKERVKLITNVLNNEIESLEERNKILRLIIKRVEFEKVKGASGAPNKIIIYYHDII